MALRALLGPTNTGKTHVALEEACAVVDDHGSAVLGFPLRLLAREAYYKLSLRLGKHKVALLTGEEKIVPPTAQVFACTVESMPREQPNGRPFQLVVVDEIQLCADRERGHGPLGRGRLANPVKPRIEHGFATLVADPVPAARVLPSRRAETWVSYTNEEE